MILSFGFVSLALPHLPPASIAGFLFIDSEIQLIIVNAKPGPLNTEHGYSHLSSMSPHPLLILCLIVILIFQPWQQAIFSLMHWQWPPQKKGIFWNQFVGVNSLFLSETLKGSLTLTSTFYFLTLGLFIFISLSIFTFIDLSALVLKLVGLVSLIVVIIESVHTTYHLFSNRPALEAFLH